MALGEDIQLYSVLHDQSDGIVRARREAHQFYITINLAAWSALGYLFATQDKPPFLLEALTAVAALLIVLCLVWRSTLGYYKRMNRVKFDAMMELEKSFPVRPITLESEQHKQGGFKLSASDLDRMMPAVFIVGYVGFALYVWQGELRALIERFI